MIEITRLVISTEINTAGVLSLWGWGEVARLCGNTRRVCILISKIKRVGEFLWKLLLSSTSSEEEENFHERIDIKWVEEESIRKSRRRETRLIALLQ